MAWTLRGPHPRFAYLSQSTANGPLTSSPCNDECLTTASGDPRQCLDDQNLRGAGLDERLVALAVDADEA